MPLTQVSSRGIEDTLRYVLGASGTDHYTFTGKGLYGTVNDPTLTLSRGHTYIFENRSGGHPFYIKTSIANGGTNDQYSTGVTNNGGGDGTEIIFTIPHDAPDTLYYQCGTHSNMNGQLSISGSVADGSITSAKIADNPSFSGTEGIKLPIGTTAQRVNTEALLRYNSELDLPEFYNGNEWKIIDTPPSLTSVSPTEVESGGGGNVTFTIIGTRFNVGVTVKFISNNGTELSASSVTRDSSTQLTAVIAKSSFVNAQEPYDVKVTNTSSLSAQLDDQINVDNAPAWVTSSGSLGTFNNAESVNVSVSATDPDGDTIAYSILSGSLPTGLSLNSGTGAITGTIGNVSSSTTYSFTIRATANSKTADRAFTMVNDGPNIQTFSYTGSAQTWTKPAGVTSITAYIWGGGGGGGAPGWGNLTVQWHGGPDGESGGSGGYAEAVIDVSSYTSLVIAVAGGGEGGSNGTSTYEGGAGGGMSGIFDSNGTGNQSYAIVIAGGGGGGSSLSYVGSGGGGGGGFGQNGQDAQDNQHRSNTGGHGGTQSSGGARGSHADSAQYKYHNGQDGGALYGGRNPATHSTNTIRTETPAYLGGGEAYDSTTSWNAGGSGGGGYYGGGAGDTGYGAGAGGGSGYAKSSVTSSVTGTTGTNGGTSSTTIAAPEATSTYYATGIAEGGSPSQHGGNGRIVLVY